MNLYELAVAKVLSGSGGGGGGGGTSNVVTGTFKYTNSEASVETVTLDYTGNGYPIACIIVLADGVLNETYRNTIARYSIAQYFMTKTYIDQEPTYASTGDNNCGAVVTAHKSSASTASPLTSSRDALAQVYNPANADATTTNCVRFHSKNSMSIYSGADSGTTRYGFMSGQEYRYWVIYSE